MTTALVLATYIVASVVAVLYGVAALLFSWRRKKGNSSVEFFLTARRSAGTFRVAWSLYAAALGSWALFSPPSYAYTAGWLGLLMYSLAAGLPVLVQGFLGTVVQRRMPNVLSFSDFVHMRYGRAVGVWVSLLMLLNMGIAMTAEFTALGDLFEIVIGGPRIPIIIIIGVVSMAYTAAGGLYVSIITDQWQAGVSLVLLAVLVVWTSIVFRYPLPRPPPDNLGLNYYGYSSIAVMPISLFSSSIYSEAIWQRCWASASPRALHLGAAWGALQTTAVVFLFGFGGFLAAWGGLYTPSGPDDAGNTILFSLLNARGQQVWIMVLVAVLSATMSESAIDSLQNAVVDNISGAFLKGVPLPWVRALVFVLNIPVIIVSLQGYSIIQLFLLANLVTTTSTLPVLLGLLRGPRARTFVTPAAALFGCLFSFASLCVWAAANAPGWGTDVSGAFHKLFFEAYDWPPFVIALGASVLGMAIMAILENAIWWPLIARCAPSYATRQPYGTAEIIAYKAQPRV